MTLSGRGGGGGGGGPRLNVIKTLTVKKIYIVWKCPLFIDTEKLGVSYSYRKTMKNAVL